MKASRVQQLTSLCLLLLSGLPRAAGASTQTPSAPQTSQAPAVSQTPALPMDKTQQQQTTPQPPGPDQQNPVQPVGTAAAPSLKAEGAPASRPAGAAIAPAKQRRIRSFSVRVGLLVGAAVAIGTVVALSAASSSQPH